MWLIPYRKLVLKTPLTQAKVTKKISALAHMETNWFRAFFGYSPKRY